MIFTLELTQEDEEKLATAAAQKGMDPHDYLLQMVRQLPTGNKRILRGYGMLAHLGATVEEFQRERQEDRVRENEVERAAN